MKLRDKRTGTISKVDGSYADRAKGTVRIYLSSADEQLTNSEMLPEIMKHYEAVEQPKTVYDLKEGDECWQIITTPFGAAADRVFWHQTLEEKRLLGLIALTKGECNKKIARCKARSVLERDTKGFNPDWRKPEQSKYYVGYTYNSNDFYVGEVLSSCELHLYFATRTDAKASIDAHPNEWKTYLGVEEQND